MKQKGFTLIIFIFAILIVGSLAIFVLITKNNSKLSMQGANPIALINQVPNFNHLTDYDLPNFGDYRRIYDYNNNKLIVGINRIVEYDITNKRYIRQNDNNVLDCINSSALIKDFLYVGCYKSQKLAESSSLSYSVLYKIYIPSGEIVKAYFDEPPPIPSGVDWLNNPDYKGRKTNLNLASKDEMLFISSWDGVMKMNTKNDSIISYENNQMFNNDCRPSGVFNDDGTITVVASRGIDCDGGIAIYDEVNNTWNKNINNGLEQEKYIKDHGFHWTIDPPFDLVRFSHISPLLNGKYYLLGTDGIYTLENGQFPKKLFTAKPDFYVNLNEEKSIFSQDGRYLVYVGHAYRESYNNEPTLIKENIAAYLIDLVELSGENLMNDPAFKKPETPEIVEIANKISKASFEEQNGVIFLKDSETQTILVSIDLKNSKLNIGK